MLSNSRFKVEAKNEDKWIKWISESVGDVYTKSSSIDILLT